MNRKNNALNSTNSTKRPSSATGGRLTRLVQALALLAVVKLTVIGLLWTTPRDPVGVVLEPVVIRAAQAASPAAAQDNPVPTSAGGETPRATEGEPGDLNRERALDKREAELKALEMELDEKLQKLRELEVRMQGLIDAAAAIRDEKMAHLIDVYSNMKPKQAAQVLGTLEETTAVRILAGMSGRKAGEILSSVRADRAAALSEALTRMQTSEDGK